MVLIRPNDLHTRRYIDSGYHSKQLLRPDTPPPYISLNKTERDRIEKRMKELYAVSLTDTGLQRTKLRTLILDIFVHYFSRCIRQEQVGEFWFDHLMHEMEKPANLSEGLPALLRISQKSHEYLCRTFKQYLKLTPKQFRNATTNRTDMFSHQT